SKGQLSELFPANSVPPYVKLGLTIVYTVFYSLLFVFIYVQLWLVLHYRHKRFSYQTVFLFLCLFWASLRTVLFSFYFKDFVTANSLSPFIFWLLYCFPVCLQFFTLTLMNLYFTQVKLESWTPKMPFYYYSLLLLLLLLDFINLLNRNF
uniref:G protein-coupled receptor 137B n=1 Tax=Accipiter nisus TaxID=211598 RepID=A0A8B9RY70_9AVES